MGRSEMTIRSVTLALLAAAGLALSIAAAPLSPDHENPHLSGVHRLDLLPPSATNPRNSEGSFVALKDGRIFFAYSKFTGGNGSDFGHADIVGRYSRDEGRTWDTLDTLVVSRDGALNVMSVSLLRLQDGHIALFYLLKLSPSELHVYVRFSSDETKTWSKPTLVTAGDGYFVMDNDRAIQLRSGRLVLPVALHRSSDGKFNPRGVAMVYLSDDRGKTWRRSQTVLQCPSLSKAGLQEPGVVELKNSHIMMFLRTALGSQYLSYSSDGGDHWSSPQPSSIASPLAAASIKRIPSTGDLLLVWNDHSRIDPAYRVSATSGGKRTPVATAISRDDGKTWEHVHNILDKPDGWYSYFAIYFVGSRTLLAFCSTEKDQPRLSNTDIVWFNTKRLYQGGRKLEASATPRSAQSVR